MYWSQINHFKTSASDYYNPHKIRRVLLNAPKKENKVFQKDIQCFNRFRTTSQLSYSKENLEPNYQFKEVFDKSGYSKNNLTHLGTNHNRRQSTDIL